MFKKLMLAVVTATTFGSLPVLAANTNLDAVLEKGPVVVGLNLLDQVQIDVLSDAKLTVRNDNTVRVPVNVAAVLCNTDVNEIASGNQQGTMTCNATADGIELFAPDGIDMVTGA